MADTYSAYAAGVTFDVGKSFLGIFNGVGSGKVIRVYRMWMLNNQTGAIAGDFTSFEIWTLSAMSGGSDATVTKHDSSNASLHTSVLVKYGASAFTETSRIRKFMWCNDEATQGTLVADDWETFVPLCLIGRWGYGSTAKSPLVLREGQGLHLKHNGTMAIGNADVFLEFTQAAS